MLRIIQWILLAIPFGMLFAMTFTPWEPYNGIAAYILGSICIGSGLCIGAYLYETSN